MEPTDAFQFLFVEPEPLRRTAQASVDASALLAQVRGRAGPSGAQDKILVLHSWTQRDVQSDEVVAELVARGAPVIYFHTAQFAQAGRLSLHLGPVTNENDLPPSVLDLPAGRLDLREVKSVWCRGPELALGEAPGLGPQSRGFESREKMAALRGLLGLLSDRLWVNPLDAVFAADDKLRQLQIAPRFGFSIPRTLVTTDPGEARNFYAACGGDVILKTFRRLAFERPGEEWLILTSRVRPEHLAEIERVRLVPCVFQEYVPKAVELRVTVVGQQVFAAEIHSQRSAQSQDDYRRYDLANTPYLPVSLPPSLEAACRQMAQHYGLALAAVDLIRRPDGAYVFLEINTSPQFLWIQDLTGLPIREAVADLLLAGSAQR
jgi:hypothetical protein